MRWSAWFALIAFVLVVPALAQEREAAAPQVALGGPRFLTSAKPDAKPIDPRSVAALQRRVTLTAQQTTLGAALEAITRQTGVRFHLSRDLVPVAVPVRVQATGLSLAAALTELLLHADVDVAIVSPTELALVRRRVGLRPPGGTIIGRVVDAKTGERVAGAEVFLEDTRWRTATDTNGQYRLAEVDTGTYTLTARRLGYVKQSRQLTVREEQEDAVDLALEPAVTRLDELVTTITGPQRLLEIANAVTVLRADSIVRTQPIKDVTDLLQTRVPGLAVLPTTGAPGDPARLRLRGSSSITRSNDPIVIMDGVRIYYEQSEARNASLANEVPAPSPLDRIDPNSIEQIEVLNGPSAAALYGADAANGVIVITTKRGRPGPARWDFSLTHGRSFMPGRFPDTYFGFGRTLSQEFANCSLQDNPDRDPTCVVDSVVARQVLNDPELTVLGRGHRSEVSLSVSGGRPEITYAVTGTFKDEVGLLRLPEYERNRFRETFGRAPEDWMQRPHQLTNWYFSSGVTFRPTRPVTLGLTMSLGGVEQGRSELERQLVVLRGAYVDKTTGLIDLNRDRNGFVGDEELSPTLVPTFYERTINRALALTTGMNLNWQPFERFTFQGNAGMNADLRRDEALLPPGLLAGNDSLGSLTSAHGTVTVGTLNLGVNYQAPLVWGFRLDAAVGVNYVSRSVADITRTVPDAAGGPSTAPQHQSSQRRDDLTSYGWYIEPRISNQRFFLSTGLRLDGGSNYGDRVGFDGFKLPKLGFAWLISDEPFFPIKNSQFLGMLRVRAAFGQAGVQPSPTDRLRLYSSRETAELDGQLVGLSRLTTLGNTQLRPERSTEIEGGFDADLFDRRLTVALTAYRKTKNDALLPVLVAPSVGSPRAAQVNIGVVRNTGYELRLITNLLPVAAPVQWSTDLYLSHSRNVVVSLAEGLEAINVGGGRFGSRDQRIVAGYPLSGYWQRPLLGYADANGDGVLQRREILLGDSLAYLGAPEPRYTAGFHTAVRLFSGALSVDAGFDYQDGFAQWNDAPGGPLARAAVDPSAPLADQALVLATNNRPAPGEGTPSAAGLVQTLSTLRFHSLSVGWRLPSPVLRWIGAQQGGVAVQGTNLGVVTNYRGKDPLVNSLGTGNAVLDAGALPQPREWHVRLSLSY